MNSLRTTIGGAINNLGKTFLLVGLGGQLPGGLVLPLPPQTLTYLALAGFIISMIGSTITSIFAADNCALIKLFQGLPKEQRDALLRRLKEMSEGEISEKPSQKENV